MSQYKRQPPQKSLQTTVSIQDKVAALESALIELRQRRNIDQAAEADILRRLVAIAKRGERLKAHRLATEREDGKRPIRLSAVEHLRDVIVEGVCSDAAKLDIIHDACRRILDEANGGGE